MKKYKSPMKIAHRKHIYLDSNDPRAQTDYDLEKYRSRSGAKLLVKENRVVNIPLEEEDKNCFSIGSHYSTITQDFTYSGIFGIQKFDSNKNMIFCGITQEKSDGSSDTNVNIILTKLSKDGDMVWQKLLDMSGDIHNGLFISDVALDNSNNIYIVAHDNYSHRNPATPYPFISIFKYSNDGNKIWSKKITIKGHEAAASTNIQFDESYTKLYVGVVNSMSTIYGNTSETFHLYEINSSSGNYLRSKLFYTLYGSYQHSYRDQLVSICYANNNIYIFGHDTVTSKYKISVIDLSSLSIVKSFFITQEEQFSYGYNPIYNSNVFFDKQNKKIYFAPKTNYSITVYEMDITNDAIYRHNISIGNITYPNIYIRAIYKDTLTGELLIGGSFTAYPEGQITTQGFLIRYGIKNKKVKYFNTFRFNGYTTVTLNADVYGFSVKGSRLLFAIRDIYATNTAKASFAFNIPVDSLILKNRVALAAPDFNSSVNKFYAEKKTDFTLDKRGFSVETTTNLNNYTNTFYTYEDLICPEYSTDNLYEYIRTDF